MVGIRLILSTPPHALCINSHLTSKKHLVRCNHFIKDQNFHFPLVQLFNPDTRMTWFVNFYEAVNITYFFSFILGEEKGIIWKSQPGGKGGRFIAKGSSREP